jgi:hypothetical protein
MNQVTDEPGSGDWFARHMAREQFSLLIRRYRPEDVILTRVLTEQYQQVATAVKRGELGAAAADFAGLEGIGLPDEQELRLVVAVAALPVGALIEFRSGRLPDAAQALEHALAACAELAEAHGHWYLTPKQLHLAVNLARVTTDGGDRESAARLLDRISAVASGDRTRWPFAGVESLSLPLAREAWTAVNAQLHRETGRLRQVPT